MDQVLRNTQPTIALNIADGNGNPIDVDPSTSITVTIRDSAGTTVTTGTATDDPNALGRYTFTVEVAFTGDMDVYTAEWDATLGGAAQKFYTTYEVVGGFIVSVAEIRAFDDAIANETDYPTARVVKARQAAEDRLELLCGRAFRPRGARATVSGDNSLDVWLPTIEIRRIVTGAIAGVALTSAELADLVVDTTGRISRQYAGIWTLGRRNVALHYEYGPDVAPEPIKRACLLLVRHFLVGSAVPDRATSLTTGEGTFRLATAGREGPTGLPEVDAIINDYSVQLPTVGEPTTDALGRSRASVSTGYPWWP